MRQKGVRAMKKNLFPAMFVLLFLGQYSRAQNGGCFFMGGPVLDSLGCSTIVVGSPGTGGIVGIYTGISSAAGGPNVYLASGQVTGDVGQVVSGATSVPCQSIQTDTDPISFGSIFAPGVHTLQVKYTNCQFPENSWFGRLTLVVLPPNPATNPPPPCTPVMIDPVKSNLLQGSAVTSNEGSILSLNPTTPPVPVQGVTADGISQAIVAIATANVGDSVQLNLINDANSPSSSSAQDGGLTTIGGSVNSLSNSVSLVAETTTSIGPTAFAIYRAPTNYARGSQNFPQDNTTAQRAVSLQTICLSSGGSPSNPTNTEVTVMRPPLVLLHGIWADWSAWDNFAPSSGTNESELWSLLIPGTNVFPINYGQDVNNVTSTTPSYFPLPQTVKGSSLGFSYNAQQTVLPVMVNDISTFATFFDVAAVQADVVAHSMGGDIARVMGGLPNFLSQNTYGLGPVDKLITVGTPHAGTPLAGMLLPSAGQDPNGCVRALLAHGGNDYSFQSVTIGSNPPVSGAVGDLIDAPSDLPAIPPFKMAFLAGSTSPNINLTGLGNSGSGYVISSICGAVFRDPLGQALTENDWNQAVFGSGVANDGVVPVSSQLNGVDSSETNTLPGVIHSAGIEPLGFSPPAELDPASGIPAAAVDLLNEAPSGSDYH